jgi:hypothetical protein
MINGVTELSMMKADILSIFDSIKICTHYEIDGQKITEFPYDVNDVVLVPIYIEMAGWKEDLTKLRRYEDAPQELKNYVLYLEKELKHDYETARRNLRELVDAGKNALDGVIAVAQEGDSPRAYEVVAQMIKTLSETNRDLLDIHDKIKGIRKTENKTTTNNTTTNSIYVGSTRELQDIINSARSSTKAFIDVQPEENK